MKTIEVHVTEEQRELFDKKAPVVILNLCELYDVTDRNLFCGILQNVLAKLALLAPYDAKTQADLPILVLTSTLRELAERIFEKEGPLQ